MGQWRYFKIIRRLLHGAWLELLAYRVNFLVYAITGIVWLAMQIGTIVMLYAIGGGTLIAGFSRTEMLLVLWFSELLMTPIFLFVVGGTKKTIEQINKGHLDSYLLRPVVPQFAILVKDFNLSFLLFGAFYYVICLPLIIYWTWNYLTWLIILQSGFILMTSFLIYTSIFIIVVGLAFYFSDFNGFWRFLMNTSDLYHYPAEIYPTSVRWFFLTIFPIFLVVNPFYKVLNSTFAWGDATYLILFSILFVGLALWIFNRGLHRYQSAN